MYSVGYEVVSTAEEAIRLAAASIAKLKPAKITEFDLNCYLVEDTYTAWYHIDKCRKPEWLTAGTTWIIWKDGKWWKK